MQNVKTKTDKSPARTVAVSACVCALATVVPQLFHLLGGKPMGNVFLPMHLPVILGGYLLSPTAALVCGVLSPLFSFFISGMPAFPRLIFMMLEFGAYGFITSLCVRKFRLPVFITLPLTWLGGRAVFLASVAFALHVLGLTIQGMPSAWATVWTAITTGFPGLILQAVAVPLLVAALRKARLLSDAPRFGKL